MAGVGVVAETVPVDLVGGCVFLTVARWSQDYTNDFFHVKKVASHFFF